MDAVFYEPGFYCTVPGRSMINLESPNLPR